MGRMNCVWEHLGRTALRPSIHLLCQNPAGCSGNYPDRVISWHLYGVEGWEVHTDGLFSQGEDIHITTLTVINIGYYFMTAAAVKFQSRSRQRCDCWDAFLQAAVSAQQSQKGKLTGRGRESLSLKCRNKLIPPAKSCNFPFHYLNSLFSLRQVTLGWTTHTTNTQQPWGRSTGEQSRGRAETQQSL